MGGVLGSGKETEAALGAGVCGCMCWTGGLTGGGLDGTHSGVSRASETWLAAGKRAIRPVYMGTRTGFVGRGGRLRAVLARSAGG